MRRGFFCVSCAALPADAFRVFRRAAVSAYGSAVRLRVKRGKLLRREFNIRRPDVFREVFWLCRSGNRDDIRVLRHNPAERNLSNASAHAAEADGGNGNMVVQYSLFHNVFSGRRFLLCRFFLQAGQKNA